MSRSSSPTPRPSTTSSTTGAPLPLAMPPAPPSQYRIQFFHPVYMESPSAPTMPWDNWLRLFRFFVTGSNLVGAADELRLAVLYGSLGAEAAHIASNLTDASTSYDETLKRLTERFGERQSVIYARSKFHRRAQQTGEDILSFVTELRRLACYCKFGAIELEVVRDRLVAGCFDDKIRERLFLEPDNLTLDNAIIIAQTVERAVSESKRIGTSQESRGSNELLKLDQSDSRHQSRRQSPSFGGRRSTSHVRSQSRSEGPKCQYCGHQPHPRQKCPARNVECRACGTPGHFAAVCRKSGNNRDSQTRPNTEGSQTLNTIHVVPSGCADGPSNRPRVWRKPLRDCSA